MFAKKDGISEYNGGQGGPDRQLSMHYPQVSKIFVCVWEREWDREKTKDIVLIIIFSFWKYLILFIFITLNFIGGGGKNVTRAVSNWDICIC